MNIQEIASIKDQKERSIALKEYKEQQANALEQFRTYRDNGEDEREELKEHTGFTHEQLSEISDTLRMSHLHSGTDALDGFSYDRLNVSLSDWQEAGIYDVSTKAWYRKAVQEKEPEAIAKSFKISDKMLVDKRKWHGIEYVYNPITKKVFKKNNRKALLDYCKEQSSLYRLGWNKEQLEQHQRLVEYANSLKERRKRVARKLSKRR